MTPAGRVDGLQHRNRGGGQWVRHGGALHLPLSWLWSFGQDGALLGVASAADFGTVDKAMLAMKRFPVAERAGLIWAINEVLARMARKASGGAAMRGSPASRCSRAITSPTTATSSSG